MRLSQKALKAEITSILNSELSDGYGLSDNVYIYLMPDGKLRHSKYNGIAEGETHIFTIGNGDYDHNSEYHNKTKKALIADYLKNNTFAICEAIGQSTESTVSEEFMAELKKAAY